jgi:hypothetical protein
MTGHITRIRLAAAAVVVMTFEFGVCTAARAEISVPNMWVARFSTFKGNLACKYGDHACNRCVHNVPAQFDALTSKNSGTLGYWHIDDPRTGLAPSNRWPRNVDANILPSDNSHFQGFARAPTDGINDAPTLFASVGGPEGGIFGIKAAATSSGGVKSGESLKYLYDSRSEHAGSMQAVGDKLLVAHYGGTEIPADANGTRWAALQVLDLTKAATEPTGLILPITGHTGMANIGATRLAGGGYLLMFNADSKDNEYAFYYTNSLDTPRLEKIHPSMVAATWFRTIDERYKGYENLNLVTECNTANTYMIGATAGEFLEGSGTYRKNRSTWALQKVSAGPRFDFVDVNEAKMFSGPCDPRGGASAFATRYGQLALYCHQKARDVNARRSGIGCAVAGLAGLITSGFVVPAVAQICLDTLIPDRDKLYEEYLGEQTPETPIVSTQPLRIVFRNFTVNSGGPLQLGVMTGSGQFCEASLDGVNAECTLRIPAGQSVALIPYQQDASSIHWMNWSGPGCGNDASGLAQPCVVNPSINGVVTLDGSMTILH